MSKTLARNIDNNALEIYQKIDEVPSFFNKNDFYYKISKTINSNDYYVIQSYMWSITLFYLSLLLKN
jgi:hypothetical protein